MIRSHNQTNEDGILQKLRNCIKKPLQDHRYSDQTNQPQRLGRGYGQISSKLGNLDEANSKTITRRDYSIYNYQSKFESCRSPINLNKNNLDFKNLKDDKQSIQLNEHRHYSIKKNSTGKQNFGNNDRTDFLRQFDYKSDIKKNRLSLCERSNLEGTSLSNQINKQIDGRIGTKQFLSEAQTKLNEFQRKLQLVKNEGLHLSSHSPLTKQKLRQNNPLKQKNLSYEDVKIKYSLENKKHFDNYTNQHNFTPRHINEQLRLKNQSQKQQQIQNSYNFNRPQKNTPRVFIDGLPKSSKIASYQCSDEFKKDIEIQKNDSKNYNHRQNKFKAQQSANQGKSKLQQTSISKNKSLLRQPYDIKSSYLIPAVSNKPQSYNLGQNCEKSILMVKSNFETFKSTFEERTIQGNQKTLSKLKKINDLNDKINQRIRNIIDTFENKYKKID